MNWTDWRTFSLVLILIAFAIYEITVGHNLDTNTSLTLLLGGFTAGGVSVGYTAGVKVTPNGTPPPVTPAVIEPTVPAPAPPVV